MKARKYYAETNNGLVTTPGLGRLCFVSNDRCRWKRLSQAEFSQCMGYTVLYQALQPAVSDETGAMETV